MFYKGENMEDIKKLSKEALETNIFSCLRKIINSVDIYSSKLKEKTNLNASQLSCLLVLQNSGPLPLSQLSKSVALSPSMITSIVDQLEKRGLVVRNRKSNDRRVVNIDLTEEGIKKAQTSPPTFQQQFSNSLGQVKRDDIENIYTHLTKLLEIIVSDVLLDSTLLGVENRLVEIEPSAFQSKDE